MSTKSASVTASLEDYLEAIFFLSKNGDDVRVTDVAIELGISKPSVNKAINILKEKGYVNHEKYGSLSLTEQGLEIAKEVATRHFVLKKFLADILGIAPDRAEEEACLIEHHLSTDTINRISKLIDSIGSLNKD